MQITNQKRMAAQILNCGVNRVWIEPFMVEQISSAVQKEDIRAYIEEGHIKARPIKGTSRSRARKHAEQKAKGRRRGPGSRKGAKKARTPPKRRWMNAIRAQRRLLKQLREDDLLTPTQYRKYYLKAKGGVYRSLTHMKSHLDIDGVKLDGGE